MPPDFDNPQDVTNLVTSVGNDLFGENGSEMDNLGSDQIQDKVTPPLGEPAPKPQDLPNNPNPAPPPPVPQFKSLPKAWKKEMQPHWEKLPSEVHDYVHSREQDILRGIESYKAGHTRWNELITPFQPLLQEHPDVNPVQLMQTLAMNHMALAKGTPEAKRKMAQDLLKHYNIDLGTTNPAQQGDENPAITALQQEIQELRQQNQRLNQGFTQFQSSQQQAIMSEKTKEVNTFFADPKNEYAEELGDDIFELLKTGMAKDLPSAYEKACYLNASVRTKILAKQQEEALKAQQGSGQKSLRNVDASGAGKPAAKGKLSWEQEADAIVQKSFSSH